MSLKVPTHLVIFLTVLFEGVSTAKEWIIMPLTVLFSGVIFVEVIGLLHLQQQIFIIILSALIAFKVLLRNVILSKLDCYNRALHVVYQLQWGVASIQLLLEVEVVLLLEL